jgi:calcineurin-like phosphoesterase family protein
MNLHGHTHGQVLSNPFYYNMCVELLDYTPMPYDDILKYMDRYL